MFQSIRCPECGTLGPVLCKCRPDPPEITALRAEVERLQSELFDLRALADKRTRDERDGWCEREGECWLMDGPCAGHDRHREGPMLKNIAADDSRIAEREEEMHATISGLTAEVERLREGQRWIPVEERPPESHTDVLVFDDGYAFGYYDAEEEGWRRIDHKFIDPTHWMPLPAPPVEEE